MRCRFFLENARWWALCYVSTCIWSMIHLHTYLFNILPFHVGLLSLTFIDNISIRLSLLPQFRSISGEEVLFCPIYVCTLFLAYRISFVLFLHELRTSGRQSLSLSPVSLCVKTSTAGCPFYEEGEGGLLPLLELVRTVSMLPEEPRQTLVRWSVISFIVSV